MYNWVLLLYREINTIVQIRICVLSLILLLVNAVGLGQATPDHPSGLPPYTPSLPTCEGNHRPVQMMGA